MSTNSYNPDDIEELPLDDDDEDFGINGFELIDNSDNEDFGIDRYEVIDNHEDEDFEIIIKIDDFTEGLEKEKQEMLSDFFTIILDGEMFLEGDCEGLSFLTDSGLLVEGMTVRSQIITI